MSDEQERERLRWIPVTERLPDDNVPVAIVARGVVAAGELYRGFWYHTLPEVAIRKIADVTHWMPLPKPPEEDACPITDTGLPGLPGCRRRRRRKSNKARR